MGFRSRLQIPLIVASLLTVATVLFQNCGAPKALSHDGLSETQTPSVDPGNGNGNSNLISNPVTASQDVTIGPCQANPAHSCASYTFSPSPRKEVWISSMSVVMHDGFKTGYLRSGSQGTYAMFLIYDKGAGAIGGLLSVIDLDAGTLIAFTGPPANYTFYNTYFGYVKNPSGHKVPFIAPGAHYLDGQEWQYGCIFDAASAGQADSSCYTGFKSFAAHLPGGNYRHNGGWVDDVNGDGWGDIHLPYFGNVLSISGATRQVIQVSPLDVTLQSEPQSPRGFDSGRLYASFTSFNADDGSRRVLIASGQSVGSFDEQYCNVSRYFTVAKWGNKLDIVWSNFISFFKTGFNYPYDSVSNYSRLGDDINLCVHRFSDSIVKAGSRKAVLYSYFKADDPTPACLTEQLAEPATGFSMAAALTYANCIRPAVAARRGYWTVQALDLTNGGGATALPKAYVWGRIENFIPNQAYTLVIENFSNDNGRVTYKRDGHVPESFAFMSLQEGYGWNQQGVLNQPLSRPKVIARHGYYGAHTEGIGHSASGVPELLVKDIDKDGLNDFQLENGRWLGYSQSTGRVQIK